MNKITNFALPSEIKVARREYSKKCPTFNDSFKYLTYEAQLEEIIRSYRKINASCPTTDNPRGQLIKGAGEWVIEKYSETFKELAK